MKFELEYREGIWYLSGVTIEGCWLWGKDLEKIARDLPCTVNYLIEHNELDLPKLPTRPGATAPEQV